MLIRFCGILEDTGTASQPKNPDIIRDKRYKAEAKSRMIKRPGVKGVYRKKTTEAGSSIIRTKLNSKIKRVSSLLARTYDMGIGMLNKSSLSLASYKYDCVANILPTTLIVRQDMPASAKYIQTRPLSISGFANRENMLPTEKNKLARM